VGGYSARNNYIEEVQKWSSESCFQKIPRMIGFFSDFGVRYPWPKYDQVVVGFVSGAYGKYDGFILGKNETTERVKH